MHSNDNFRTPMKQVRGLGTAHSGVHHFWLSRMTAVALVPLTIWFLIKLLTAFGTTDRGTVQHFFQDPISTLLMAIFMVAMLIHSRLGIQTIIEDYVHCRSKKLSLLVFSSAAHLLIGAASLFALVKLHFLGL